MALADLVVNLTAETAQFRVAMERAAATSQKTFDKMYGGAQTLAAGIAAVLSADMFVGFIKASIDAMDRMDDMSEKVGIAADTLSKLAYAAKFSNVDIDGLNTSLVKLSKAAVEAASGSASANESFKTIGVSVKDSAGNLKSTEQLLYDIADAFTQYEDGAGKVAIATSIFGKSGAELIPFLNGGRKGIQDMGIELEKLGGVITPQAAKQAAIFNDNLDRLKTSFGGLAKSIANDIIPVLNKYMEEIIAAEKAQLSFTQKLGLGLTNPFKGVDQQVASLTKEITKAKEEAEKLGRSNPRAAATMRNEIKELEKLLTYYKTLQEARSPKKDEPVTAAPKRQIKMTGEADKTATDNAKKLADLIKQQTREIDELVKGKEALLLVDAKTFGANQKQIDQITSLIAQKKELVAQQENEKKIQQIVEAQNKSYNELTKTQGELAVIELERLGASQQIIKSIEQQISYIKNYEEEKKKKEELNQVLQDLIQSYNSLGMTEDELLVIKAKSLGATQEEITLMNEYIAMISEAKARKEEENKELERSNQLQERYKQLISDTNTQNEQFAASQEDLLRLRQELIDAGYEEAEVNDRISKALIKQHDEIYNTKRGADDLKQTYKLMGQTLTSSFEQAILQAKDFQSILKGLLQDILAIIVRKSLTDPFANAIESAIGNMSFNFGKTGGAGITTNSTPVNNMSSSYAFTGRANGGMVNASSTYLVGERGPELFKPISNGTMIPNNAMGGGNVSVNINNYSGTQVKTSEVKDSRGNRAINVQIGEVVASEIRRNGSDANMSVRSTFGIKPALARR